MFSSLKKIASIRKIVEKSIFGCSRFSSSFESTKKFKHFTEAYSSTPFNFNYKLELQKENGQFMLVFPDVVRELTDFATDQLALQRVAKHFERVLEYNVPHGKKLRGLTAVLVYKELVENEENIQEKHRQGHLLGWCIELLQSTYLISDDIMDRGEIRRGKACWHKLDDVQQNAINDVLLIENGCYYLLKRSFGHLPCYTGLFEMFHETALATFIGQTLDSQIAQEGVTKFTMDKHITMSNHKTSHSAFFAPVALPMILAGYKDSQLFEDLKSICFEMGHFYQVQNDFLDCFSDGSVLNKPGTDIEEGKCTWLAVKTMQYGTNAQKAIMESCYGKSETEYVEKVKQVYMDFDFPKMYRQHEDMAYHSLRSKIEIFSKVHNFPEPILLKTLNRQFNIE